MNKCFLFMTLVLNSFLSHSQIEDAWVYFTDKQNVEISINNPTSILSSISINRKILRGVSIDEKDVPINETYITEIKNVVGITVLAKSKWMNNIHVRGTQENISSLVSKLFVDKIVFANKNLSPISKTSQVKKRKTIFKSNNKSNSSVLLHQNDMLNIDELHDLGYKGDGIKIAVLDAGFPGINTIDGFMQMRDNGNFLGGYDFVDRVSDVFAFTSNAHGTQVLSTITGYIENQFEGSAPDASVYLFRTEDVFSETPLEESLWLEAAERADSLGVDIINSSLGYTTFDNSNYNYSKSDMDGETAYITKAANLASEKGILVVNSAGNSGANTWGIVGAPADSEHVFSVGAVNSLGEYAFFSSTGDSTQPTIKPDVMAMGHNSLIIDSDNSIKTTSGTSFSGPIIAGAIACLWQTNTNLKPTEIKDLVRESSSNFTTPNFQTGYGIPDFGEAKNLKIDSLKNDLNIYPNPFNKQLIFENLETNSSLNIYSNLGELLYSKKNLNNKILLPQLSKGIYFFTVKDEYKSQTFKMIKN